MSTRSSFAIKITSAFGAIFLIVFSGVPLALASSPPSAPSSIPPALISYIDNHPGEVTCLSGQVNPFLITSATCPKSSSFVPNTSTYSIDCSGACLAGTDNTGSTYYTEWSALYYVPTVPSSPYKIPYVSEWIGLSTCVPSCGGEVLQAGVSFGSAWGATDSHHPGMWVEYYTSTGPCSRAPYCGNSAATNQGDSMGINIQYQPVSMSNPTAYWDIFESDGSTNPATFVSYTVYIGPVGSGDFPSSSVQYGLASVEGHGANSANEWPGLITFTQVYGEDTSYNYQLGNPGPDFAGPSGTALTASISYTTTAPGGCYAGICANIGLQVT